MKQLTCEMCGSTDLVKDGGVFVCQSCGCKYSVEEARKMMIEGVVEVKNAANVQNLLVLAQSSYNSFDYKNAENYCNQIIAMDSLNYDAWFLKGVSISKQPMDERVRTQEVFNCLQKAYECLDDEQKQNKRAIFIEQLKDCAEREIQSWVSRLATEGPFDGSDEILKNSLTVCMLNMEKFLNNMKAYNECYQYFVLFHDKYIESVYKTVVELWENRVGPAYYGSKADIGKTWGAASKLVSNVRNAKELIMADIVGAPAISVQYDNGYRPTKEEYLIFLHQTNNLVRLLVSCVDAYTIATDKVTKKKVCDTIVDLENYLLESKAYKRMESTTTNGFGAVVDKHQYWEEDCQLDESSKQSHKKIRDEFKYQSYKADDEQNLGVILSLKAIHFDLESASIDTLLDIYSDAKVTTSYSDVEMLKSILIKVILEQTGHTDQKTVDTYEVATRTMRRAQNFHEYERAANLFDSISSFYDAQELAKKCVRIADSRRTADMYSEAENYIKKDTVSSLNSAIRILKDISDYKDASEKLSKCEQRIKIKEEQQQKEQIERKKAEQAQRIKQKQEAEEKQRNLEKKERKKQLGKRIAIISVIAVLVLVGIGYYIYSGVLVPKEHYEKGVEYYNQGEYIYALNSFKIGKGENKKQYIQNCKKKIYDSTLKLIQAGVHAKGYSPKRISNNLYEILDYKDAKKYLSCFIGFNDNLRHDLTDEEKDELMEAFDNKLYIELFLAGTWKTKNGQYFTVSSNGTVVKSNESYYMEKGYTIEVYFSSSSEPEFIINNENDSCVSEGEYSRKGDYWCFNDSLNTLIYNSRSKTTGVVDYKKEYCKQ